MSERYDPKRLLRERREHPDRFQPDRNPRGVGPREQVVYRDGKPTILKPLLCRLHNQPWQTCTLCSKLKR